MKIAIFGASVSAQSFNHATGEVTGYAEVLRREHAAELGAQDIRQITYPGNRMSDGGLVRLADVVAWRPDICVLEPLVEDGRRGKHVLEVEKRHIYVTLLEAGILPVTLLLPEPLRRPARDLPHYNQYVGISRQYGLPVIEVDVAHVPDPETKFNGVHTLHEGARVYARQIVDVLKTLGNPRQQADDALMRALGMGRPKLCITTLQAPPNAPKQLSKIALTLVSENPDPMPFRLIQHQHIGPFSPVVNLSLMRGAAEAIWHDTLSIWDEYCHYRRPSYVMLADSALQGAGAYSLSVALADVLPDYALCRKPVAEWPQHRHMEPAGDLVIVSAQPITAQVSDYR